MAKISSSRNLSSDEIDDLMRTESRLRIATIGPRDEINLTPMTFGWAGGRLGIGEVPADAMVREVKDETGLIVRPLT